jgi:hypothetical protein
MGAFKNSADLYLAKVIDNKMITLVNNPPLMVIKYDIYTGKLISKEKVIQETLFETYKVYQENASYEYFNGFNEPH